MRDTGGESFRTENAGSVQFNVPLNDAAMLNANGEWAINKRWQREGSGRDGGQAFVAGEDRWP